MQDSVREGLWHTVDAQTILLDAKSDHSQIPGGSRN